jgi:hypothetical protein
MSELSLACGQGQALPLETFLGRTQLQTDIVGAFSIFGNVHFTREPTAAVCATLVARRPAVHARD